MGISPLFFAFFAKQPLQSGGSHWTKGILIHLSKRRPPGRRIFSLKNSSLKRWPSEPKFWWPFFLCFRNQLLPANRYQKQRNPLREPHNFLILKKYRCEKNISFILKKTVILNKKDPYLQFASLFDFLATAEKWALNPQFQRWFALIKPFRK